MAIIIPFNSNIISKSYGSLAYIARPTPGVEASATAQAKKAS
jgi:hypothetical protein